MEWQHGNTEPSLHLLLLNQEGPFLQLGQSRLHRELEAALLSWSAGFGWDRVNFLHSSWYGAVFWICDENGVDNSGMF